MKRIFIISAILSILISFGGCGALKSMNAVYASYRGDVDQTYMVQDARNRILSYDWFYDQKGQIDAQIANIEATKKDALERDSMIRIVNSMIGDYNARSKQYNHNLWKANDLPYEIELYKGETK